jgi:hypothetical protein
MRALKLLIIIMGIALIAGTALLVGVVVERARQPRPEATAPRRGFDRVALDLPAGAHLTGTELAGDRLLLRLSLTDGGEELILLDARTGQRLGTVALQPAPGSGK